MIAITAAAGNIGRQLTGLLAAAAPPARLLVRDRAAAATVLGTLGRATEVVETDLDRPASLDAALAGVSRLFLLSPGPDTPAQDAAAIAAAVRAGVGHVVLLSSLGVEAGGIGGGTAHAPGEQALTASGLDFTILRPSEFMTNTLRWLPEITTRATVSVPTGHGRVGFVDPADIAAVAFAALTEPGHTGRTYRLTGPELLSTAEAAARLGEVLATPVEHHDVTDTQFRESAAQAHLPEPFTETLSQYYRGVAAGRMEMLSADIEQVTGKPPTTFANWARVAARPAT